MSELQPSVCAPSHLESPSLASLRATRWSLITPPTPGDVDSDGVADADDLCERTPAGSHVWTEEFGGAGKGCAPGEFRTREAPNSEADADGDGVVDDDDRCPDTPSGARVWHDEYNGKWKGCGKGQRPVR